MEAKKNLKNSRAIVSFYCNSISWDASTLIAFYGYLYIKGLLYNNIAKEVCEYDAFTDLAFNPNKKPLTAACQVKSWALFQSDAIIDCVISKINS